MIEDRRGVRFPITSSGDVEGRSTTATGAQVLADSLATVDPTLAAGARDCTTWRTSYAHFFAASTARGVQAQSAVTIAEDGLRSAWDRIVMVDGAGETPLSTWTTTAASQPESASFDTAVVRGGADAVRELTVPYRGRTLGGRDLEDQLTTWEGRGIIEPGFANAIREVIENPGWLSMPGYRAVLLGAGAAMGPLEQLSAWGADIVAVDVPVPEVWRRIRALAAAGAGTVTIPVHAQTQAPGIDLSADLAGARRWLSTQTQEGGVPVLSTNTYADGAAHVGVNLAADVLACDVVQSRAGAMLAYLNTPTDSYLVPEDAVREAQERAHSRRWNGPAHLLAARASGRRLFCPGYDEILTDGAGTRWGLSDTLVDIQGPNYALAKRIQRWRAVLEHDAGRRISSTVAPASWTRSVTKNRILASVYAGAAPFGVEIFQPETARALMAAKLVADAFRDLPGRGAHPKSIFLDAAHGGLWRQPFEPRTALGVAALLGAPRTAFTASR